MNEEQPRTFTLGDMDYPHQQGNAECTQGWCGDEYPKPCERRDCPGLVHANFGDENWDGDYWLYTKCDECGEPET